VHEGHHYGVAVDEIFEIEEVVAKKLASKIDKDQLFVGATVLGEGEVGYILSVEGVALRAGIQKNISVEDFGETPMEIDSGYQDFMQLEFKQKGLYAVEIDYVHRLEIFSKERIEYTGSKPFVRYQNRPMPLLFIDKMQEKFESDLSVIVLRYDGKLYGLVVSHIKDIGQTQDEIDVSMADDRMIKGTVFINEKTVSIIDLEKVLSESINLNEISDKEKVAA
jgi:two-component system chemotaxis sensor kinase CheA